MYIPPIKKELNTIGPFELLFSLLKTKKKIRKLIRRLIVIKQDHLLVIDLDFTLMIIFHDRLSDKLNTSLTTNYDVYKGILAKE